MNPVGTRRELAAQLRRLRTGRALTQSSAAALLDWSTSKIVRIENGSVAVDVVDLRALLGLYGVDDPTTVERLVEMTRRRPIALHGLSLMAERWLTRTFAALVCVVLGAVNLTFFAVIDRMCGAHRCPSVRTAGRARRAGRTLHIAIGLLRV